MQPGAVRFSLEGQSAFHRLCRDGTVEIGEGSLHVGQQPDVQNTQGEGRQNLPSKEGEVQDKQLDLMSRSDPFALIKGLTRRHLRVICQNIICHEFKLFACHRDTSSFQV